MNAAMVKICGIKDPDMAARAAQAGANFIGLIFAPNSRRLVSLADVPEIVLQTRLNGAEPVAVFTEQNAQQMMDLCQSMEIKYAQLHGEKSCEEQHLLPANISRIYACRIDRLGRMNQEDLHYANNLQTDRDFLLFDYVNPGSGEAFDWENFSYSGKLRWFLAGGLNVNNVRAALSKLQPFAVDVSSGVEIAPGQKDAGLIQSFIATVLDT